MTLEDYIRSQYYDKVTGCGAIDFAFRASVTPWGGVEIYIHPMNVPGETTPTVQVKGDTIVWPQYSPAGAA